MKVPYRVVLADPPWPFYDRLPGDGRGAEKHYSLMTIEEIKSSPLPELEDDSWLFLWRVTQMQEEAIQVMKAWGFTLKSEIVWNKLTVNGKPWFGMGRTVRMSHEVCLIGSRGKPVPNSKSIRSVFAAKAGRHSEKPEKIHEIIEQFSSGPYLELFARKQRAGWTCLGDEVR